MAISKFGSLLTDLRNSIGSDTYSRNKGGAYVRTRSTPANPQTTRQQEVRAKMTNISQAWASLSDSERQQWIEAAANFPYRNQFGDTYFLSGIALHNALNLSLANISKPYIASPPAAESLPGLSSLSVTARVTTNRVRIAFSPSPIPAGYAMNVYATDSISPGINYVKNRLRWIYYLDPGDSSPFTLSGQWNLKFGPVTGVGNRISILLVPVSIFSGQLGTGLRADTFITA